MNSGILAMPMAFSNAGLRLTKVFADSMESHQSAIPAIFLDRRKVIFRKSDRAAAMVEFRS